MFVVLFISFMTCIIVIPIGILFLISKEAKEQNNCEHKWVLAESTPTPSYWYCSSCRMRHEKLEE